MNSENYDVELVRQRVLALDEPIHSDEEVESVEAKVKEATENACKWIGCAERKGHISDGVITELLIIFDNDIGGLSVLDLGCGAPSKQHYFSGKYHPIIAEALHALGAEVTGVDFRKNPDARYNHVIMDFFDIVDGKPVQELQGQFDVVFMRGCSAGGIRRGPRSSFGRTQYECMNFESKEYVKVMNHFLEYARQGALINVDEYFIIGTKEQQRVEEQQKKWKQEEMPFEEFAKRKWMECEKLAKELFEKQMPIEVIHSPLPRLYRWALKK